MNQQKHVLMLYVGAGSAGTEKHFQPDPDTDKYWVGP